MSCHSNSIKNGNDQSLKFNSNNYSYPLITNKNHISSKPKPKQSNYPTNLIPFKRLQKIKKVNKKIKSIEKGKSKELNNILLKYKLNRDFQLNFLTNESKTKLSNLRRLAHEKQSFILKENQQQTKLLHKRIIKDLQKIKEKLLRNTYNNNNTTMDHIKQEIETIFNDSVSNINHMSSRRITRNRAKSQLIHTERRKNIDFTKYKFGLNPLDITSDLKYLIIKEKQLNNDNIPTNNNEIFDEFDDYDYDNISIGFISHPMGFLNDRHLFGSQLTGIYKKRAKRITSVKSRRIIREMFGNENNYNDIDMNNEYDRNDNDNDNHNGNVYGQICVFEKADEVDNDYVMNGNGNGNNVYDNDDEILKNAVYINNVRFTSGDRIRIIEHNYNGNGRDNIQCGVIKCVMKYHMKIIVGGYDIDKPKRIRYKDINQGYVSVFLQA